MITIKFSNSKSKMYSNKIIKIKYKINNRKNRINQRKKQQNN